MSWLTAVSHGNGGVNLSTDKFRFTPDEAEMLAKMLVQQAAEARKHASN